MFAAHTNKSSRRESNPGGRGRHPREASRAIARFCIVPDSPIRFSAVMASDTNDDRREPPATKSDLADFSYAIHTRITGETEDFEKTSARFKRVLIGGLSAFVICFGGLFVIAFTAAGARQRDFSNKYNQLSEQMNSLQKQAGDLQTRLITDQNQLMAKENAIRQQLADLQKQSAGLQTQLAADAENIQKQQQSLEQLKVQCQQVMEELQSAAKRSNSAANQAKTAPSFSSAPGPTSQR
jgi:hypothetical protein